MGWSSSRVRQAVLAGGVLALVTGLASPAVAAQANRPPDVPKVTFAGPIPVPCGTVEAPVPLNKREFVASVSDPDGDHSSAILEVFRGDGTLAFSRESAALPSGTRFSMGDVPDGVFVHDQTYHFRARGSDGQDFSPYSQDCYFTVDKVFPGEPRISSTDYPDGEPAIPARTTGTVTLRPAEGDTDVVEYYFGFRNWAVSPKIKAGPDGTAVLPLTLLPDPSTGDASGSLYVGAIDKAGNHSGLRQGWDLAALKNPAPPAHEPGDLTGDGRADVTALLNYGAGRTVTWNVVARDGGFHAATRVFDTAGNGGGDNDYKQARGDFDGDGRTDLAMLRQLSDGKLALWELVSDGANYAARTVWDSGSEALPLSSVRALSGDFNADGKADIALQLSTPAGWRVLVFPGGSLGHPVEWLQSGTGGADFAHARLVAGDFDGDGKSDLAELRDQGGCQSSVRTYRSGGTAFEAGVVRWGSAAGAFCADRGTPVTGDVDGDGKAEIVTAYDHGGGDVELFVSGETTGFVPASWWREAGRFDPAKSAFSTGDFDLDGKTDVAVVQVTDQTRLWTLRSTGAAFAAPVLGAAEVTGGTPVQPGR
ncbi:FG-GAP repeat domain-containing protein [Amycolatopsis sp. cg5]|uniref:FG-GAP repeat domain-containing protein n=1 Tax=Amycolatopsis sp. cg5 TaxID=3238802 RepID=UPI003524008C